MHLSFQIIADKFYTVSNHTIHKNIQFNECARKKQVCDYAPNVWANLT